MTVKRTILGILTLLVSIIIGQSLISSWNEPQVTSRLQLYQTDLLLQAAVWEGEGFSEAQLKQVRSALLGDDPLANALKAYEEVRETAETNLTRSQDRLTHLPPEAVEVSNERTVDPAIRKLQVTVQQQVYLIEQLDLRIGILQAEQGEIPKALRTWKDLVTTQENVGEIAQTAAVLIGLWQSSPRIEPKAESWIQQTLTGWFRYRALARLYQRQQQAPALANLAAAEQVVAQKMLLKLFTVGFLPTLGCLLGIGLIGFMVVQRVVRGAQSWLMQNAENGLGHPLDGRNYLAGFGGGVLLHRPNFLATLAEFLWGWLF